jgi:hypothetical protein
MLCGLDLRNKQKNKAQRRENQPMKSQLFLGLCGHLFAPACPAACPAGCPAGRFFARTEFLRGGVISSALYQYSGRIVIDSIAIN